MKEIRLLKEKGRDQKGEMSATAATAIQRVWRGFITRRMTKKRKRAEQLLIGMELPPYTESQAIKRAEEVNKAHSINFNLHFPPLVKLYFRNTDVNY